MKILVAGDFCQRFKVDEFVRKKLYGEMFDGIKPVVTRSDYSIVNFEFPIVREDVKPKPIPKCGPNLKGTKEAVEVVKYAGFKCCTLANNHILDQGEECALYTKIELEKAGIDTVGFGDNLKDAEKIRYIETDKETLAIINCCEHEFSIATEQSVGTNPLNPIRQFYVIKEAKKNADYVLVIVHGGHELYQLPSPRMQETYRFFIDAGADAVVNHHQHCYSGYEIYNSKPIFYGLGNLLFDNGSDVYSNWNEGYMVCLDTVPNSYEVIPYQQCVSGSSTVELIEGEKKRDFFKSLSLLNDMIKTPQILSLEFSKYTSMAQKNVISSFSPYSNIYMQEMGSRGWIPLLVSKKKILQMINNFECESHRDLTLEALHNYAEQ